MSIVLRTPRERNIRCSIWAHLPAAINPSTHRALHKKSGKPGGTLTWGQRIFKGFSIIVVAEVTCLGVAYIQWSMMNRDQNYRYYLLSWNNLAVYIFNVTQWPNLIIRNPSQVQNDSELCWQFDAGGILCLWRENGPK